MYKECMKEPHFKKLMLIITMISFLCCACSSKIQQHKSENEVVSIDSSMSMEQVMASPHVFYASLRNCRILVTPPDSCKTQLNIATLIASQLDVQSASNKERQVSKIVLFILNAPVDRLRNDVVVYEQ
ncbi:MAG: hypothetical protein ACJAS1_001864 [Oleiphilaceae bacterium]|jgi:hypothetical protein